MAKIVEDIAQLSENIGPRPAGTEEEQQAALYIADELQKSAGFSTVIEDFNSLSSGTIVRTICFAVGIVAILVSLFAPVAAIPCFVVAVLAAVVYVLEINGTEVISRFFHTGVSQNVVAKYQPNEDAGARTRKVILVANYDSDKEDRKYKTPLAPFIGKIRVVSLVALAVAPIILLIKTVFFTNVTGGIVIFFNVLEVICMILMALPLVDAIMKRTADYTQAANNNAASVGVLLETARTIGNGLVTEEDSMNRAEEEGIVIHGMDAAAEAGVIPEDTDIEYEAAPRTVVSPEESLAAAKAAIMALTGKPVADKVPLTDISSKLVQVGEPAKTEASSVHFEVDESIGKQPLRASFPAQATPRARIAEKKEAQRREEERIIKEKEANEEAQQKEKKAAVVTAAVNAAVSAVDSATASAAATTQAARNAENVVQSQPVNVVPMPPVDNSRADKTPAWAKSAQAKAHANRPELEINKKVSRSRFADTPAAHITDATLAASGATNAFRSVSAVQDGAEGNVSRETYQKPMTELEARLAALHSEIAAAEAPHISEEAKAAFEKMDASIKEKQQTNPVSQPVPSDSAVQPEQKKESVSEQKQQVASTVEAVKPVAQSRNTQEGSSQAGVKVANNVMTAAQPAVQEEKQEAVAISVAPEQKLSVPVEKPAKAHQDVQQKQQPIQETKLKVEPEVVEKHSPAKAASTTSAVSSTARSRSAKPLTSASPVPVVSVTSAEKAPVPTPTSTRTSSDSKKPVASNSAKPPVSPTRERVTVEASIEMPESTKPAQGSISGKTQAIAPIDVSTFLNKEEKESGNQKTASSQQNAQNNTAQNQAQSFTKAALVRNASDVQTSKAEPQRTSSSRKAPVDARVSEQRSAAKTTQSAETKSLRPNQAKTNSVSQQSASPIVGMESIPTLNSGILPKISENDAARNNDRQVIVLPDVVGGQSSHEENKQRAPMAQSNESTRQGTKALLSNMIPRIADNGAPSQSAPSDSFGLNLPSLNEGIEHNTVSATGSFSTVGGTGAFAPVGDELIDGVDPDDLYVDDADDSAYDQEYTQTGAFAGPGYVEMPKSRAGRLFGKFRSKKKAQQEQSVSEWINADENYEARSVGKARGNWESFRDESFDEVQPSNNAGGQFIDVDYSDNSFNNPRDWNGGGFSLKRFRKVKDTQPEENEFDAYSDEYGEDSQIQESNIVNVRPVAASANAYADEMQVNQERQMIQNFRYPGINTEVWFVALGAENYNHSGMQAFINEHKDELKGATIINLEALGAGKLTFLESEGIIKPKKVSSRVKRFLRAASEKTKVFYSSTSFDTRMTTSRFASLRGYQAFTLMGMEGNEAALYGNKDDVLANIDQKTLNDNTEFVMAILKSL